MTDIIQAMFVRELVLAEDTNASREIYDKGRYGEPKANKRFQYSLLEALYLLEKEKMVVSDKKKVLTAEQILK